MKTLLIVDDELIILRLLKAVLTKQYIVIEATTAEQARRLFVESGYSIDLLVADVTLPTSSGIELAVFLRSLVPGLPVILTSGYPQSAWCERDGVDLKNLGSHLVTILPKPFQALALLTAIRELIDYPESEIERTARLHAGGQC